MILNSKNKMFRRSIYIECILRIIRNLTKLSSNSDIKYIIVVKYDLLKYFEKCLA